MHPEQQEINAWWEQNRDMAKSHTLGASHPDHYLENRLTKALQAGIAIGRKLQKAEDLAKLTKLLD